MNDLIVFKNFYLCEFESMKKEHDNIVSNERVINLGELLFQFDSYKDWWNNGADRFRGRMKETICIDSIGRICNNGGHFKRAEKEKAYPIKVYNETYRT